jgi:nucleotide-binding universal stress UspA family protein
MNSQSAPQKAVVAGVDGSTNSDQALDWAVDEAARRGLQLHIIHAFSTDYPLTSIRFGHSIDRLRELAVKVRTDSILRARCAKPDLDITWDQPTCGPAAALVSASETADTLVVGAQGMGATRGPLMGSVSTQVAEHAHCPVVVVHKSPTPTPAKAPVVVGIDGSASSRNAIAYAFEQASSRGVGLKVLHAWWVDYGEAAAGSSIRSVDWQMFAQEDQALVAESLTGWQEKYPDVTVRRHSVRAFPVGALAHESKKACLVVVGTRGCGGFAGLALGSVSQGVMHRARCPVAIVRSPTESHHIRNNIDISAQHLLPVLPLHEQS